MYEDVIRRDEAYSLGEFKRRTVKTDSALRTLKTEGLHIDRIGKRAFVRGSEFLDFLERRAGGNGADR